MSDGRLRTIKLTSGISAPDIVKHEKMSLINRFLEEKESNPKLTKRQVCAKAGMSESTLNRVSQDLGIGSFYRFDVPLKKRKNQKIPSRETKIDKRKKHKGETLAGADPNEEKTSESVMNYANTLLVAHK